MNQKELWEYFGREILNSKLGDEKKKYLSFLSCTWYDGEKYDPSFNSYEDLIKITKGYVALGGGGLALFGTASLFTWPDHFEQLIDKFSDKTPIDRTRFLDDSCYRGTYGFCFSTTLGSVLHELFHTFDLGHTEYGIMNRGFDDIYKFFTVNSETGVSDTLSKAFKNKIEFKEEFEAEKLSERLQNVSRKKHFSIIKKYDETDDTFLSKSCAIVLYYHKWFNQNEESKKYVLSFDKTSKFISATNGIRVVEIRNLINEMVLIDWTFEGKILKIYFQLPDEYSKYYNLDHLLVVEDSSGNILKNIL
ncbi:unnamed protein product [Brassicogethes aeneus]|nr:unnamed protein product [Brassicogethes aeneus]